MKRYIYDLETLSGLFTASFLNYDDDTYHQFVITNDFSYEEHEKLVEFVKKEVTILIGFNSVAFDDPILNWVIQQSSGVAAIDIYKVAQDIIKSGDFYNPNDPYKRFKWNKPWKSIDLFLYWSKMLRLSKKLSLKYFESNMDLKIQEMPIHHTQETFTDQEITMVLDYNLVDCRATKELAKRLKDQINLRIGIKNKYGLDALNFDAPKIASEILLDSFCKKTWTKEKDDIMLFDDYKKEVRRSRFDKKTFINGHYLPKISFKTETFKGLYDRMCKSSNGFKEDLIFKRFDGSRMKISYGSGGIHSVHSNEKYDSDEHSTIWTSDVSSLYPTLLENYKFIRKNLREVLSVYSDMKRQRFEAKKSGDTVTNETLKLVLNSTTGLLDNEYSWLYSPAEVMALRLTGQLILSRLTEECDLNSLKVISLNTDGVEIIIPHGKEGLYLEIIDKIEEEFNLEFEHEKYKFIYYKTVNDYIALKFSGKVKVKGEFIYEKVLDGSNEFLVVPIAVKEYFVNGTPVEETIMNHKNIYDFCCSKKISRDYEIWYMEKKQQQLNRFFVSKKGGYLYKRKLKMTPKQIAKGKKPTLEHIFKDSGVTLLNDITNKTPQELEVDFQYYILSAKTIIELFNPIQLSIFDQVKAA
jgi:hypothetical protein